MRVMRLPAFGGGKPHIKKRREQRAAYNAVNSMVVAAVPGVATGARRLLAM